MAGALYGHRQTIVGSLSALLGSAAKNSIALLGSAAKNSIALRRESVRCGLGPFCRRYG
jgi:hypothetical protein